MLSIDVIITDHTIFNEEMFSLPYERFKVADEIYAVERNLEEPNVFKFQKYLPEAINGDAHASVL